MTRIILTAILVLAVAVPESLAIRNTVKNRERQADRYMEIVSINKLMKDATEEIAKQIPEKDRETFKNIMNAHLDMRALEKSVKELMVKHFTADEIKALTDFYGSSAGESVMQKFGAYSADTVPLIQDAVIKAIKKAEK